MTTPSPVDLRLTILTAHHDLKSPLQGLLSEIGVVELRLDLLDGPRGDLQELYTSIEATRSTAQDIALWARDCSPEVLAARLASSDEMGRFKQGFEVVCADLIGRLESLLSAEGLSPGLSSRDLARLRALAIQYGHVAAAFRGALSPTTDNTTTGPVDIDLHDYLATVVTSFQSAAEAKGLRLEVECCGDAHGRVRAHLLGAVLQNLIGNAVKYTDQGSVTVRCRASEGCALQIEVVDTGIGIDPDTLLHLTEPGVRGQAANVLSRPGDGLGLASAAAAAIELGGTLRFTSRLGEGTTAVFELRTAQD
jgi:signal transduction histidine kinase